MVDVANTLNQACHCRTLNPGLLRQQLERDASLSGLDQSIARTRPHLFSDTAVFLSRAVAEQIDAAVAALDRVAGLPVFQTAALQRAPAIARHAFGPTGVFMGYDFHLGSQGLRLIEVNTNAGGALLNVALARAQQACCESLDGAFKPDQKLARFEDGFFAMFDAEWRSQCGQTPLRSIAIVDDDPGNQYLAAEFELCRQWLHQRGLESRVVDASALEWRDGRLHHQSWRIDMVYNRLTDFYLSEARHDALRQAYETGAVVVTPHPRAHALHADKRHLVDLCNIDMCASSGMSEADRELLSAIVPPTDLVTTANADELWTQRRRWFFKPVAGYGARGAYRGDKVTRRVWQEIRAGGYVAQALEPPGERAIELDGTVSDLKFDVRAYAFAGAVQLLAARMYAGQTTNFRTPGGGFAPVIVLP